MDKTEVRVEGASWFTISRNSGINLGKVTKEWPVVFTFEENLNPQERTANVHLTIDGYTSLYEYQLNKRHSKGIRYFIPGFNYNN